MDPISGVLAIAGLGMQLFGSGGALSSGLSAANIASQEAGVSQSILGLQEQENAQRQLAMQITARRQQVQTVRETQMRMAQGQSAAVAQGGLQSSGYAGGQAQVTGEGAFGLEGINQQLSIGNTLFGLQNQVSGKQQIMAQLQGQQASLQGQASIFQGLGQVGGSIASQAGPLGNIISNFTQGANASLSPENNQWYSSMFGNLTPQMNQMGGAVGPH